MPKSAADLVREFHETFGLPLQDSPALIGESHAWMRQRLLLEETREVGEAVAAGDLPGIAQELADVVYVAYGTALAYGIPLDAVLAEVHRANMSKLDADGKPLLREDGKVLKSPLYRAPDIASALARQETPEPDALDRLNRGLAELGMPTAALIVSTGRGLSGWPEAVVRLVHADDPEAGYVEIRIPFKAGPT